MPIFISCIVCGREFLEYPYRRNAKFCSYKCYWKYRIGKNHHWWRGGSTPSRQRLYSTPKWKKVSQQVWKGDDATCQRCDKNWRKIKKFHIHHIVPFTVRKLRVKLDNLILLCRACHCWVHSRKNVDKEFIKEI